MSKMIAAHCTRLLRRKLREKAPTKPNTKTPIPHKNERLTIVNPTEPITDSPPKIIRKVLFRKSLPTDHPCCIARSSYPITMNPAAQAATKEVNKGVDIIRASFMILSYHFYKLASSVS